jgi:hypothetical protein
MPVLLLDRRRRVLLLDRRRRVLLDRRRRVLLLDRTRRLLLLEALRRVRLLFRRCRVRLGLDRPSLLPAFPYGLRQLRRRRLHPRFSRRRWPLIRTGDSRQLLSRHRLRPIVAGRRAMLLILSRPCRRIWVNGLGLGPLVGRSLVGGSRVGRLRRRSLLDHAELHGRLGQRGRDLRPYRRRVLIMPEITPSASHRPVITSEHRRPELNNPPERLTSLMPVAKLLGHHTDVVRDLQHQRIGVP